MGSILHIIIFSINHSQDHPQRHNHQSHPFIHLVSLISTTIIRSFVPEKKITGQSCRRTESQQIWADRLI